MKREYDAIVVGGGLAGLTSAAYLSRYGLRTLLCEKRQKTGGLVETFWREGFAFDAGIRAFEDSGILFPMLKDLEIDIEFAKNEVSIAIGDRSVKLASQASLEDYMSMLTALFPDNASDIVRIKEEIRKVMEYMDVLYGIDNPLFMRKMDLVYLSRTLLPWFLKYQMNIRKANKLDEPISSYLRRFTKNIALIDMITQHFFKETPTFFALSYFSLYLDYCYPIGGTGVLADRMTKYVQSSGGEVLTDAAVIQVDAKGHQLRISNGEAFAYKRLVWAADQKTLYSATEGVDSNDFDKQRLLCGQSKGCDSVLTLFLGLNQAHGYFQERCGAHMFFTPSVKGLSSLQGWDESESGGREGLLRWVGEYLERTTYEISCPAIRDKALAPEGKTGLIVSTLFDYSLVKRFSEAGDYERFKDLCTQKILDILDKSLCPGVQEWVLFSSCATPMTIERETSNLEGAITGWSFTNRVLPSENRFRKITNAVRTPIPDVYQCGQWTFSPSGLPVSILTGKIAADRVRKELK